MTCYAYDKKLAICLIYGCPCDCDSKKECFHKFEEVFKIATKKAVK